MFERYTEKARRVIFFGRYEAAQFGSPYIETEHLLLGILREDKVIVNRFLKSPGAVEGVRKEIEGHSVVREKVSTSVDLPLSNEGKRMLAYAAEEAERFAHKHIAVGHLLIGLLREEKCFAAELLRQRGISLSAVREFVKKTGDEPFAARTARSASDFDIAELGVSLTASDSIDRLPFLIGREHELDRVIQVLCRLTRGNPVLVGESGVGKKSIVYGLAHRIVQCKVPTSLQDHHLIRLDLAVIASGLKSRARFEDNLERILDEFVQGSGALLFVEGLHTLAQTQRFLNLANVLKPGLMRGSIHCISTTTPAEYQKAVEAAPWLEQFFTVVEVRPPSESEATDVLRGVKERFERFHEITYTDEAIQCAVFHANSYFPDRYLPEKAIDLLDEAGARTRLRQPDLPAEVLEARKKVKFIQDRHDGALNNHEFEKARFYSDQLRKEQDNLKVVEARYNLNETAVKTITRDDIEKIVAEKTGASIESLRRSRTPSGADPKKD